MAPRKMGKSDKVKALAKKDFQSLPAYNCTSNHFQL